jgi:hypothetical protein
MDLTRGAKWFSALDLTDGYWNVLIHPDDRHKTAFTVAGKGRFQWRSMPFGYHGSGPHFQRVVEAMLAGLSWGEVAVYVDDVLCWSDEFDNHVRLVDTVLSRLREGGFVAAPKKCKFFARSFRTSAMSCRRRRECGRRVCRQGPARSRETRDKGGCASSAWSCAVLQPFRLGVR